MAGVTTSGTASTTEYPWLININPQMTPYAHTNWNTVTSGSDYTVDSGADAQIFYGILDSTTSAQNNSVDFLVVLAAGTWDLECMAIKGTDRGIITYYLDLKSGTPGTTSVGTYDLYNAASLYNQRATVTGISVAATGVYTLRLKMATKNASASAYQGGLQHLQLRRTA